MDAIVRRFIKTAFAFLGAGVALGLGMLVARDLLGRWPGPYIVSAHVHALFVGFVLFMILGVALWLFPKPLPEDRRYRPARVHVAYWLLLAGTLVRLCAELIRGLWTWPALGPFIVGAGLLQALGIGLYVWNIWSRIRPSARRLRAARSGGRE